MDVIAGQAKPQNGHSKLGGGHAKSALIIVSVLYKLEKKIPIVATVGHMIQVTRNDISIRSRHKPRILQNAKYLEA